MRFEAVDSHSATELSKRVTTLMSEGWVLVRSGMMARGRDYPVHWAHLVLYEEGDLEE